MIDLIIPYYNNPEGLKRTLASIEKDKFYITLIDDNSDYTPWCPTVNQVFRYNMNRGPGYARQLGLDHTYNEWIIFIDTGDTFISKDSFNIISKALENNPDANFISFPYFHNEVLTKETDNRLHGKIYKRAFLEKYGITFTLESSYLDEDVGFNRTCRLCTNMLFIPTPIIQQNKDPNSLTQKDNQVALYRDQTRALSLVSLHTIEICRKNNIDPTIEINQIALALYYWFIRTAAERPIYIQDAWTGARIFYTSLKEEIDPNKLLLGNVYMKKCLYYRGKISFPINVLRFMRDIQLCEHIPQLYKGGD